jgi:hypothetical protein
MCGDSNACSPVMSSGELGDACSFSGYSLSSLDCEPGLYCDQFDGCQPGGESGDPCLLGGDGSGQCVSDHWCEPLGSDTIEGTCQPRIQAGEACLLDSPDGCHGRCEPSADSQDPAFGECMDIPAVCLHPELRPAL